MTNKGSDIKHPKLRGEWAELRFMARAAEHGLLVTKPWGDTARYDFVVERKGKFLRVQVKSTASKKNSAYGCSLHSTRAHYQPGDFDFLAAYLIPLDLWFIIPAHVAIRTGQKLYLSPHYPQSIYEPYREAWHLLTGKRSKGHSGTAAAANDAAAHDADQMWTDPEDDSESENDHAFGYFGRLPRTMQPKMLFGTRWRLRR